jgi:hypothetical protein
MKKYIGIIILFLAAGKLEAQTENNSERLITQLKNGTAPGLKFMRAPAAIPATPAAKIQTSSNQPLASEQAVRKEQTKIVAAPPVVPNQEERKKETPAGKQ